MKVKRFQESLYSLNPWLLSSIAGALTVAQSAGGPTAVPKWIRLTADMSLSCRIRGSVSAWESWWVAAEGEQGEGDEGVGTVESECDSRE